MSTTTSLLPHVPLGRLFGLIEVMAETTGRDDLFRLAATLRLPLDQLHPLLHAAQLLHWARVEDGDYDLTDEGRVVAGADDRTRRRIFRDRVRDLPLIAAVLRALAAADTVPREDVQDLLGALVPPSEAVRQVDTAINWGRWAGLFDYDADAACFLRVAGEDGA